MIRLIASDVDGTLVKNADEPLPEVLFELIEEMSEKGIYFAAATGRQYPNVRELFAPVSDRMFFLTENGCATYFRGERIRTCGMNTGREDELIDDILRYPGGELWINTAENGYTIGRNPQFLWEMEHEVHATFDVIGDPHAIHEEMLKISLLQWHEPHVPQETVDRFRAKYGQELQVMAAGHGWLDFIGKEAGKGSALKGVLDFLQISGEELTVFGDNENDVSMFRLTPNAYVMHTSYPHVKAEAKYICTDVPAEIRRILDRQ